MTVHRGDRQEFVKDADYERKLLMEKDAMEGTGDEESTENPFCKISKKEQSMFSNVLLHS